MSDYRFEYEGGALDGIGQHGTPSVYGVYDRDTGKKVGEVTAWDKQQAGDKVASGDWDEW